MQPVLMKLMVKERLEVFNPRCLHRGLAFEECLSSVAVATMKRKRRQAKPSTMLGHKGICLEPNLTGFEEKITVEDHYRHL